MAAAPATLVCRDVWKLFGARGAETLARLGGNPDAAALAGAGLVGAVRGVSLEVHDGEVFVIMGLSGSGKSTLVRCLSRLIEPTAGEILLNGRNLLAESAAEMTRIRRHKMGMVFQHFALLPHLNVLDNVAFPLDIQGMARPAREAKSRAMIALVGLSGREDAFPRQLSGGQQQRVGIARSLAVEPDLWFLDEPFSALDPLIRREMQAELIRLQSVLKKTIVFITHDFDEAIRLADRIAIMKDGAIDQIGTPEDLVIRPATDYVSEFTRDVSRAKVLSVAAIMSPAPKRKPRGGYAGEIPASAKIADISGDLNDATQPFAVVDASGGMVGQVSRDDIVAVLMQG